MRTIAPCSIDGTRPCQTIGYGSTQAAVLTLPLNNAEWRKGYVELLVLDGEVALIRFGGRFSKGTGERAVGHLTAGVVVLCRTLGPSVMVRRWWVHSRFIPVNIGPTYFRNQVEESPGLWNSSVPVLLLGSRRNPSRPFAVAPRASGISTEDRMRWRRWVTWFGR
jgi:hypothetical protein